jgi:carbon storage regulator CsrA
MLVLTRRPGESIVIGRTVVMTVEAVTGNKVKLSFDAPREISILREELFPYPAPPKSPPEETPAGGSRYFADCP